MKDMEFLNKKDLEYFEKKAKNGEAVIIRLSPERLLSMDIRELLPEKNEDPLNEQQVCEWLQENKVILEQEYKEASKIIKENEYMQRRLEGEEVEDILVDWLKQVDLDDERLAIVKEAIEQGVEKELLLLMIREDLETSQVEEILGALNLS